VSDVMVHEAPQTQVMPTLALRDEATELETWAFDLSQAYVIAQRLVTTSFVPRTYAGKAGEAAAAIMTGREIGLSPLAALRAIDIIQGTPAMRAITLRALVQSSGHEIWVDESTATRAVVRGRRRNSDKVETSEWSIDRARSMQLLSKDNWKKQPTAMLLARATSELARLIAADVLLGLPYSVEELDDVEQPEARSAETPAPKRSTRTARRAPLPERAAEPTPEPTPEVAQEPAPSPEEDEVAAAIAEAELPPLSEEPVTDWATAEVPQGEFGPEPELDWGVPGGDGQ
jgi:hypothetical protein